MSRCCWRILCYSQYDDSRFCIPLLHDNCSIMTSLTASPPSSSSLQTLIPFDVSCVFLDDDHIFPGKMFAQNVQLMCSSILQSASYRPRCNSCAARVRICGHIFLENVNMHNTKYCFNFFCWGSQFTPSGKIRFPWSVLHMSWKQRKAQLPF